MEFNLRIKLSEFVLIVPSIVYVKITCNLTSPNSLISEFSELFYHQWPIAENATVRPKKPEGTQTCIYFLIHISVSHPVSIVRIF